MSPVPTPVRIFISRINPLLALSLAFSLIMARLVALECLFSCTQLFTCSSYQINVQVLGGVLRCVVGVPEKVKEGADDACKSK